MDLILGTAGHIDHGKTALVRCLTGMDCDRLEEEKRRGITIDLGFAWMDLPDGRRVGIVDVPGHERFVKNMVAGASGVDCVLFVVAADEGVMPQTREHLEICSLLGIKSGIIALTKTDLVDSEWLEVVREDMACAFADTFLENAPVIPVSSITGSGIQKLREELAKMFAGVSSAPKTDILRLPVDRIFRMKGFGTIVTGTIISGSCAVGEKLSIFPAGRMTRARSLEVHGRPVEMAGQGQRCAMNLQGLEVSDIQRGNVVARPDTLFPSMRWIVLVKCLKSARLPIKQRTEVHFHHGAAECMAKIVFLDRTQLEPGESALAEARFSIPIPGIYGDHCVLRSQSPLRAIGGCIAINPLPPPMRKRSPDYSGKIRALEELAKPDKDNRKELAPPAPLSLVELVLNLYPAPGLSAAQMQVLTALPKDLLSSTLADLASKGEAWYWDASGNWWLGKNAAEACLQKCKDRARALHERYPFKISFAASALAAGWGETLPEKCLQKILDLGVKEGCLEQTGSGYRLASHKLEMDAQSEKMLNILLEKIMEGKWMPPFIREILEEQNWDPKKAQPILNYLCDCGKLLKIQDGVYYDPASFSEMVEKIRQWFEIHAELEVGDIKTMLGLSRKYSIPFLEYLDSMHMTSRTGNKRTAAKNLNSQISAVLSGE